jgi:hypothetical protein
LLEAAVSASSWRRLYGIRDYVIVLEYVHPRLEVAVRQKVKITAFGVKGGIEAVVEIIGDRRALFIVKAVEENPAVPVGLYEGIGDPFGIRGPGIIADLPVEFVVLEPVGGINSRYFPGFHVGEEYREVLVTEEDFLSVRGPFKVVPGGFQTVGHAHPISFRI